MKIQVFFFAAVREAFGESSCWIEVPDGSRIDEVLPLLETHEKKVPEEMPIVFAVNEHFEAGDKKLQDGDELALMPPVSGG